MIVWSKVQVYDRCMTEEKRREKAVRLLQEQKLALDPAFGIFLAQNPDNLFEIISLNEFLQPGLQRMDYRCIGLAVSELSAQYLAGALVELAYMDTGEVPGQEYFRKLADGEEAQGKAAQD